MEAGRSEMNIYCFVSMAVSGGNGTITASIREF
jgi:hypothetical protein